MTHAFGFMLLTMMSTQPAAAPRTVTEVPVVDSVRKPCEATQDGPRHPTIVGPDGRFDHKCYDPKVEALKMIAEYAALKGHGTVRLPIVRRR
jgi:hypothetical protein